MESFASVLSSLPCRRKYVRTCNLADSLPHEISTDRAHVPFSSKTFESFVRQSE